VQTAGRYMQRQRSGNAYMSMLPHVRGSPGGTSAGSRPAPSTASSVALERRQRASASVKEKPTREERGSRVTMAKRERTHRATKMQRPPSRLFPPIPYLPLSLRTAP
jgi:hypothetical protein